MRLSALVIGSFLLVAVPLSQVAAARPSGIPIRKTMPAVSTQSAGGKGIVKRAEKRQAQLTRMVNLSRQRLDRYRAFLTKVQTRMNKLQADGHDVSRFTSYISLAQTNITAVDTAITHMTQTFAAIDPAADMKTIRDTARTELTAVRKAFTTLHTTMKQVVDQIINQQATIKPTRPPKPTGNKGQGNNGSD